MFLGKDEVIFANNCLQTENEELRKEVTKYQKERERTTKLVEALNLSGLNSKQTKLVKKYFKERDISLE